MTYPKMTLEDYLDILASSKPAPGGGTASALAGSQAAALVAMVCGLTIGKKRYSEVSEEAAEIQKKAITIQQRMLELMQEDAEAFNTVSAAFMLPKSNEQEIAERSKAIQAGLLLSCYPPLQVMENALACLRLSEKGIGRFNLSAASDLAVSALMAEAAVRGAWYNVLINLGSLKDQEKVKELQEKGESIHKEAIGLAKKQVQQSDEILKL